MKREIYLVFPQSNNISTACPPSYYLAWRRRWSGCENLERKLRSFSKTL